MMFVILHPHSNTNPSDKYRVVDGDAWMRFVNGVPGSGYTIASQHDNYQSAVDAKDRLNGSSE